MKKILNKNFNVVLIALMASILFILVNIGVWDNAKASSASNDENGGINFFGQKIENTRKYEFSEACGNFRPVVLKNENIETGDQKKISASDPLKEGDDLVLSGGYVDFLPVKLEDGNLVTLREEAFDDYEYGKTASDHKNWELRDLHFAVANQVDNSKGACLGVTYCKEAQAHSGTQAFELYFKVICKDVVQGFYFDEDMWTDYVMETHDSFTAGCDVKHNGIALPNAGLNDGTFERALWNVNEAMRCRDDSDFRYDNIVDAIKDGRIEIELTKVVCERKENGRLHFCDPSVRATINVSDWTDPNKDFSGNVDHTKYKDNDTHYVYDTKLVIKDIENQGKFFHISHMNESGWFITDANDFEYHVTVEGPDGSICAEFTVGATDCGDLWSQELPIDYEMSQQHICVDWFRVDSGDKDILREIVKNPSLYKGYKVYVDSVYVED